MFRLSRLLQQQKTVKSGQEFTNSQSQKKRISWKVDRNTYFIRTLWLIYVYELRLYVCLQAASVGGTSPKSDAPEGARVHK